MSSEAVRDVKVTKVKVVGCVLSSRITGVTGAGEWEGREEVEEDETEEGEVEEDEVEEDEVERDELEDPSASAFRLAGRRFICEVVDAAEDTCSRPNVEAFPR